MKFLVIFVSVFFLCSAPVLAKHPKPPKAEGGGIFKIDWTRGLPAGKSKKRYFPEAASPLYKNGRLFIGTHAAQFLALDVTANGKTAWRFEADGPIACPPVAADSTIIFGTNKGFVYALSAESGETIWNFFAGGEVLATPLVMGRDVMLVTTSREVYSLKSATGELNWVEYIKGFEPEITMRDNAAIAGEGGRLYIAFADSQIVSLNAYTGEILYSRHLADNQATFKDIDSTLAIDGSYLYGMGYFGAVFKMNRHDGTVIWKKDYQGGTDVIVKGQALYITTQDGRVLALNESDGTRLWEQDLHLGTLSHPHLYDNYLLVGTSEGKIAVIDATSGAIEQYIGISGGFLGHAITHEDKVYLMSSNAKIYALHRSK